VIAVLIGINFGCYFAAKQATVKHNFAVAEKLMWFSPLTEMYDSELDDYIEAGCMMENRQFREAIVKLTKISNYSNAEELSNEVYYRWALQCADKSDFSEAVSYMTRLSEENYRDSEEKLKELKYRWSMELINKGEYLAAFAKLRLIQEYPNAKETLTALTEFVYQEGQNLYHEGMLLLNQHNIQAYLHRTF
jgi:hypothetical protein